jgi:predicted O-methyltransferase YrrM
MFATMDSSIQAILSELEEHGRRHDAREQEHRRRLLNLEPETAQLLAILVRSSRRARVLEIGTSNGYSTIWLAWAVGPSGRVVSIERDAHKQEQADANLRRAGLRETVDLILSEATPIVAALDGPFDCVFFDADRRSAPDQLAALLPKLTPDAFLLADNVLSHRDENARYLAALDELPDFDRVIVPIGKGLSVAYRSGGAASGDPGRGSSKP